MLGAVLLTAGALAWHLRERRHIVYTDADTIRQDIAEAAPRDVLWQPPAALPPGINSTGDEYEPALSRDGLTLLFVRGGAGGEADLYASTRSASGWSEPQPITSINTDADELGPTLAVDGSRLYFCSDRGGGAGGYDIWCSLRTSDGWSEPFNLGPSVNSRFNEFGPAATADGGYLYFASNRPEGGPDAAPPESAAIVDLTGANAPDYDLYLARITPDEIEPAAPVTEVNTEHQEGAPAVSPHGDFLYFTSDRPGGAGGYDLYRAWRVGKRHRAPVNLQPPLNSTAHELDPTIGSGGFGLYFSSDRPRGVEPPAEDGRYDLYVSMSREVFPEVNTYRARLDWGALWAIIGPALIWLVILLLLLLAMFRLARDARFSRVGLLARCLLGSVLVHALILFLLTFWGVSSDLSKWLDDSRTVQVALRTSASGSDLAGQVRAALTRFDVETSDAFTSARSLALDSAMPEARMRELAATEVPLEAEPPSEPVEVREAPAAEAEAAISADAFAVRASDDSSVSLPATARPSPAVERTASIDDAAATPSPSMRTVEQTRSTPPASAQAWQLATAPSALATDPSTRESLSDIPVPDSTVAVQAPEPSMQGAPAAAPDTPLSVPSEVTTERIAETDLTVPAKADPLPRRPSGPVRGSVPDQDVVPLLVPTAPADSPNPTRLAAQAREDSRLPDSGWSPSPATSVTTASASVDIPTLPQAERRTNAEARPVVSAILSTSAPTRNPGTRLEAAALEESSSVMGSAAAAVPGAAPLANLATSDSPIAAPIGDPAQTTPDVTAETEPIQTTVSLPETGRVETVAVAERTLTGPSDLGRASPAGRMASPASDPSSTETADVMVLAAASTDASTDSRTLVEFEPSSPARTTRATALARLDAGSSPGAEVADAAAIPLPTLADASASRSTETSLAVQPGVAPSSTARAPVAGATSEDPLARPPTSMATAPVEASRFDSTTDSARAGSRESSVGPGEIRTTAEATPPLAATGELDLPDLPLDSTRQGAAVGEARTSLPSAGSLTPASRWSGIDTPGLDRNESSEALNAPPAAALAPQRLAGITPDHRLAPRGPGSSLPPSGATAIDAPDPLASIASLPEESSPGAPANGQETLAESAVIPETESTRLPLAALELDAGHDDTVPIGAPTEIRPTQTVEAQPSLASTAVASGKSTPSSVRSRPWLLAGRARAVPDPAEIDLDLPAQAAPISKPYEQRAEQGRIELVETLGGSEKTEEAVSLALQWLAAHQSRDGRWDGIRFDDRCGHCGGRARVDVDIALTGLSLLCFLAADHTHVREGPYRENVERALDWLIDQQGRRGDLLSGETMYSHGIASIALAEAYGMTHDAELAEPVRAAADFIFEARNRTIGGWRYGPGQIGDTSVLGWQIMALTSAQRAGVPVPEEAFDVARRWMKLVDDRSRPGLYAYKPDRAPTPAMTAEATFVRQLIGDSIDGGEVRQAASYLLNHPPDWEDDANTYYWYYATLALFQQQGDAWAEWNELVKNELLAHQYLDGTLAGSWDPDGQWANVGGRVYQTAMCTLTLEVYYRYLPLYLQAPPGQGITRRDP
jgi:Tol biopolymer transport system component